MTVVVSDTSIITSLLTVGQESGLREMGLMGVLIEAKQHNLISKVAPLIASLETDAGFGLGPVVRKLVLERAGEG